MSSESNSNSNNSNINNSNNDDDNNKQEAHHQGQATSLSTGTIPIPEAVDDSSSQDVDLIFVLGGPGVGKGTLCTAAAHDYGLRHLCMGDLLREERDKTPKSKYAIEITNCIEKGLLVPGELSVGLLRSRIVEEARKGAKIFLIDGFPRNQEQLETFEKMAYTLKSRVLVRAATSGRTDDTEKTFNVRYGGYEKDTLPIIQRLLERHAGNYRLQCEKPLREAYKDFKQIIEKELGVKPIREEGDRYNVY